MPKAIDIRCDVCGTSWIPPHLGCPKCQDTPQSPKEALPGKEVPWETEMLMHSFLCVLEEACHREIDEAGPFIVYNPEGAPFAVPLGEKTMRNMFYRIRDALRKRYGEAHAWHEKMEARRKAEHESALAEAVRRARGDGIRECIKALRELQETYCHQRKWNSSSVTTFAPVELSDWLVLNVLSRAAALPAGEEGER